MVVDAELVCVPALDHGNVKERGEDAERGGEVEDAAHVPMVQPPLEECEAQEAKHGADGALDDVVRPRGVAVLLLDHFV